MEGFFHMCYVNSWDAIGSRSTAALSVAALCVALLGCGSDTTGPAGPSLASTYDLVLYEGQSLPAVTRTLVTIYPTGSSVTCLDKLTSLAVSFNASRYAESESHLMVCDDGRQDAPSSVTTAGSYVMIGGGVQLDSDPVSGGLGSTTQRTLATVQGDDLTVYQRTIYVNGSAQTFSSAPLLLRARH